MNLEGIRLIIAEMQNLRKVQRAAKANLVKFLCGNEKTYEEFKHIAEGFDLNSFDWIRWPEYGKEWANVFALIGNDPLDDQVLDNLFTLTSRDCRTYGKMISDYDPEIIKERTMAAEFVASYPFPADHHEWVKSYCDKRNAAYGADPQAFERVVRILRDIWRNVVNYAIAESDRNWLTTYDFNDRFSDSYAEMMKNYVPQCIELTKKYNVALAWMDEYQDWRKEHPVDTSITMEELENLCADVDIE